MKTGMKIFCTIFLMMFISEVFGATGDCWERAANLKSSQAVTLVNEWDEDWGECTDLGCYYLKFTAQRGQSYTVWTQGASETMYLDGFNESYVKDDGSYCGVGFRHEAFVGNDCYMVLHADDWAEEDPSAVVFYVVISGSIGESIQIHFSEGEVYPTYTYEFSGNEVVITGYKEKPLPAELIIPSTIDGRSVVEIDSEAFRGRTDLTNVVLPDGVRRIGEGAFEGCSSLVSISLPNGLTRIEDYTFSGCENLSNISIPDSVVHIGESAFAGCANLRQIDFPDSVQYIGDDVVEECSNLEKIKLGAGVVHFPISIFEKYAGGSRLEISSDNPFYRIQDGILFKQEDVSRPNRLKLLRALPSRTTSVSSYAIPSSVTSLEWFDCCDDYEEGGAFEDCAWLKRVVVPGTVKRVPRRTFANCVNLTEVVFEEGVEQIDPGAFVGCENLTSLKFPASLKSLTRHGEGDWYDFSFEQLENVIVAAGCPCAGDVYRLVTDDLDLWDGKTNPWYAGLDDGLIVLGDWIVGVKGECAAEVVVPNGIRGIGWAAFSYDLESLHIGKGVRTIEERAWESRPFLVNVTVDAENSAYVVEDGVLFNKSKTELLFMPRNRTGHYDVPETVRVIGRSAFEGCALSSVKFPDGLRLIEFGAFHDCANLASVAFGAGRVDYGMDDDYDDFANRNDPFYGTPWYDANRDDPSGTCPDFLVKDGVLYAVTNLEAATEVVVPDHVRVIGTGAFNRCTNLASVIIGDHVERVEADIFDWRAARLLRKVAIGSGVTHLSSRAFSDCDNLSELTIDPANPAYAVRGDLVFNKDLTRLVWALPTKTTLADDEIPASVVEIGDFAFYQCDGLSAIRVPDTVERIGNYAFPSWGDVSVVLGSGIQKIGVNDCDWEEPDDGSDLIVRNGWLLDFSYDYWEKMETARELVIPNGVVGLADGVLAGDGDGGLYGYRFIELPDTLHCIGENAFRGCSKLEKFKVSSSHPYFSVDEFGVLFDKDKTKLIAMPPGFTGSYTIPDTVQTIGAFAFSWCQWLSVLDIPPSVKVIEKNAFEWCRSLVLVRGGEGITSIAPRTTYIRDYDAGWENEAARYLDTALSVLADWVVGCDAGGEDVSLPTDLFLPTGIKGIADGAFTMTYAMSYLSGDESDDEVNDDFFDADYLSPEKVYRGAWIRRVDIPDTVETIGSIAFAGCRYLRGITIPDSVRTIGVRAFYDCTALRTISIPEHLATPEMIEWLQEGNDAEIVVRSADAAEEDELEFTFVSNSSGGITITGCTADTINANPSAVRIPDTIDGMPVTEIAANAFANTCIAEITIPAGVTSLGSSVFESSSSRLRKIEFLGTQPPRGGVDILKNCPSGGIVGVYPAEAEANWLGVIEDGKWNGLKMISSEDPFPSGFDYTIANGQVTITGSYDIYEGYETLEIPESIEGLAVTRIGDFAFSRTSAWRLKLPHTMKEIGTEAFLNAGFAEVDLGEGVSKIGRWAFDGCESLAALEIPQSVAQIGDEAFYDCDALTEVRIRTLDATVGATPFAGCDNLRTIHLPAGHRLAASRLTYIDDGVTAGVSTYPVENIFTVEGSTITGLKEGVSILDPSSCGGDGNDGPLVIPRYIGATKITAIGDGAFAGDSRRGCRGPDIPTVVIPDTVTQIGAAAFENAECLEKVYVGLGLKDLGRDETRKEIFQECHNLENVWLTNPNGLASLGQGTFEDCGKLKHFYVGTGIKYAGDFYENTPPYVGDCAFTGCTNIVFQVADTANYAVKDNVLFSKNMDTLVSAPSVKGDYRIPEGVKTIWHEALSENPGVTSVHIPASVTKVGVKALQEAGSITNLTIACGSNAEFWDGSLAVCDTTKIRDDSGEVVEIVYKSSLQTVQFLSAPPKVRSQEELGYGEAFGVFQVDDDELDLTWLVDVKGAYSSLNSREWTSLLDAEGKWQGLTMEAAVDENAANYTCELAADGGVKITGCGNLNRWNGREMRIPDTIFNTPVTEIADFAFYASDREPRSFEPSRLIIPGTVKRIGEYAFASASIGELVLNEGLEVIGAAAFAFGLECTEVVIPASVKVLGDAAFNECLNLHKVIFLGDPPANTLRLSPEVLAKDGLPRNTVIEAFYMSGSAYGTYPVGNAAWAGMEDYQNLRMVSDTAEAPTGPNYKIVKGKAVLRGYFGGTEGALVVPNLWEGFPVTAIDAGAFGQNPYITSLTVGYNVQSIGFAAFEGCVSLERVVMGPNVTSLGEDAFWGCRSLTDIYIYGDKLRELEAEYGSDITIHRVPLNTVEFDKAEYTVKENAVSLKVNVRRTGKSGSVAVRYETVSGTAKPGEDFKPIGGVLVWVDGDTKAKTLTIPLIPDLRETWEGADRRFRIVLTPDPSNELVEGVSKLTLGAKAEATVILQETAKMDVGTIQFDAYAFGNATNSFTNPKKPAITVPGGTNVTLRISREGAADGEVGVRVTMKADSKTTAGTDFTQREETFIWDDGENDPRAFVFETKWANETSIADKTVTVTLTALKKGTKEGETEYAAKLGAAKSVTVTIRNPKVAETLEERIAADKAAKSAVTLAGTKGVWYFDADGNLHCIALGAQNTAKLSLAVTGPGRLTFNGETHYVGAGKETVPLSIPGYAATIESPGNGELYRWEPLGLPTVLSPADKSVVTNFEPKVELDENADGYNLYVTDSKSKLGKTTNTVTFDAGKTYYWRVDSVMSNATDTAVALIATNKTVYSFTVALDGAPVTTVTGTDAEGTAIAESEIVILYQGVRADLELGTAAVAEGQVAYSVVGGKLPGGLRTSRATRIEGVPSAPGTNTVVFQAKQGKVAGVTRALTFVVKPIELALGTFAGVAEVGLDSDDDAASTNRNESLASVSLTVAKTGALSAKVKAADKSFTFKGTGFDAYRAADGDRPAALVADLFATAQIGKATVTNTLSLAVPHGPTNNADVVFTPASAELRLAFQNGKLATAHTNVYSGALYRDNRKEAGLLPALAAWEGYYTVSLPVAEPVEGAPQGAGYVTVTIDKKGSAKLTGVLGEGTSTSLSAVPGLAANDCLVLPLYSAKSQMAFGGELVLKREMRSDYNVDDEAVAMSVVDEAQTELHWFNADPKAAYDLVDGGFALPLAATGGLYDKLVNFQRYYLDYDLAVASDPTGVFQFGWGPKGSTDPFLGPVGEALWFEGNKLVVDKQKLEKSFANKNRYDFDASTNNPSGLTVTFTQATGVFKGTFTVWYENADTSKAQLKQSVDYAGVLTPVKAQSSPFASRPGLGYYKLQVQRSDVKKTKWQGSWLFAIGAEDIGETNAEKWANEGVFGN